MFLIACLTVGGVARSMAWSELPVLDKEVKTFEQMAELHDAIVERADAVGIDVSGLTASPAKGDLEIFELLNNWRSVLESVIPRYYRILQYPDREAYTLTTALTEASGRPRTDWIRIPLGLPGGLTFGDLQKKDIIVKDHINELHDVINLLRYIRLAGSVGFLEKIGTDTQHDTSWEDTRASAFSIANADTPVFVSGEDRTGIRGAGDEAELVGLPLWTVTVYLWKGKGELSFESVPNIGTTLVYEEARVVLSGVTAFDGDGEAVEETDELFDTGDEIDGQPILSLFELLDTDPGTTWGTETGESFPSTVGSPDPSELTIDALSDFSKVPVNSTDEAFFRIHLVDYTERTTWGPPSTTGIDSLWFEYLKYTGIDVLAKATFTFQ